MPDQGYGNLNDLLNKSMPNPTGEVPQNAPAISPVAPNASPMGKIAPLVEKIKSAIGGIGQKKPPVAPQAPNTYQTELQKRQDAKNQMKPINETYKNLNNPELAKDLTPKFFTSGLPPEVQTWFTETYNSNPDFAKAMDRFHQSLLAVQHDLPLTRNVYQEWEFLNRNKPIVQGEKEPNPLIPDISIEGSPNKRPTGGFESSAEWTFPIGEK